MPASIRPGAALPSRPLTVGAIVAASAAAFTPAQAQTNADASASPVVVIVRVPKPWYAPRSVVVGKMRDTIPQYANLPGLAFKAFSFEQASGDYGGVYFWRDPKAAKDWFGPAWFARVKAERGADANVRFFEAPVTLDNTPGGTLASEQASSVATLVEIAVPAGITRDRLVAGFQAAVPDYQKVPGLLRKHFTLGGNASFGGVYIWRDEAAARAWFNDAWHQRVKATYGAPAKIEWFDVPILTPTLLAQTTSP